MYISADNWVLYQQDDFFVIKVLSPEEHEYESADWLVIGVIDPETGEAMVLSSSPDMLSAIEDYDEIIEGIKQKLPLVDLRKELMPPTENVFMLKRDYNLPPPGTN